MRRFRAAFAMAALATAAMPAAAESLPRFPNLHGGDIVFVAAGNLWRVPRAGGAATRLTSDPGQDWMPRFSPDGKWIAFTASIEGNRDVYAMPAAGGMPVRLTFHSDVVAEAPDRWGPDNLVVAWTPDSKNIVFLSRRTAETSWNIRLFEVPVAGGLPTPLPLDSGSLMSFGADADHIAYTRIFRDFRTWKRYDGGLAQKIFTYDVKTRQLDQITHWKGTDTAPMWYGGKLYFLSDRDEHRRANIWCYDFATKAVRQITHFTDYDIDFPSLGDSGIAFQQGGGLWVIDLPSETLHRVPVTIPDDGTRRRTRMAHLDHAIRDVDTAGNPDYDIAPNGKRAAFSARGDIVTVPAEHGATRNLTETSGADEDHPAWSPDGTTIAYTTDRTGEQQIAVRPAQGGAERILTHFPSGFYYTPVWSADGRKLLFSDANHRIWWLSLAGGEPKLVYQDKYAENHDARFSPDGRYIAFSAGRANQQLGIHITDTDTGRDVLVSRPFENDSNPVFSPDGKYLYFISNRHENPTMSQAETNFATLKTAGIYAAPLTRGTASPFAPQSDEGAEEKAAGGEKKEGDKKGADKTAGAAPVKIDFDGLMDRAVAVPIEPANLASLDARDGRIIYQTNPLAMVEGTLPGEKPALHLYDLAERKDSVIAEGLDNYALSADGTRVLIKQDDSYTVADVKEHGGDEKKLDLSHMQAEVSPPAEWAEMFDNAWRLQRDLFVNPTINGVNWQAVHDSYAKLLPLAASRSDVTYLIGQMLGEMDNSHTYVGGGDDQDPTEKVPTALLGVDFALDPASGRYRFATIYPGDNTRAKYRSPLTAPGLDVHAGDYLLAVNGHALKAPANPFSLFVGVQSPVRLSIAPSPGGTPRDILVEPVKSELPLREQAMIDRNRAIVDRLSGGRVAYIYLSNMESLGMEQFIRQFYPQLDRQALIVDDRWNGGGFIDQMLLERLRRVLVGMDTNRERATQTTPNQVMLGPKICLLNHYSASDGDIFPYYFRAYGLGPLLGTRSWGGVRGIRGNWKLLDGGYITIPEQSLYGTDSQWKIENIGVTPDIEVEDTPGELAAGHDRQLETAVGYLLDKLKQTPVTLPPPPAWTPAYPPEK